MKTAHLSILTSLLLVLGSPALIQAQMVNTNVVKAYEQGDMRSAIEALFGHHQLIRDSRVMLQAPAVAANGGAVPVRISTGIRAKRIALFQDANPKALVALWSLNEKSIADYEIKIKLKSSGNPITLRAVVEGLDGRLYYTDVQLQVALGGCDDSGGSYYSAPSTPSYRPSSAYTAPLSQYPQPRYQRVNSEAYKQISENRFKEVRSSPLSTFSTDVDTASYAVLRNYLMQRRMLPPKDAVRIEEMINYFDYDYEEARDEHPFYINARVGESIWNPKAKVIQIGLQTQKVDINELPASNLVFLLDVSGSMYAQNKLPLLIKSLKMLVQQLRPVDRVSIVVYAGSSGVILNQAKGSEKGRIYAALDSLRAGGSTAGGAGIKLAYDLAERSFIEDGNNRVILATDGDFNVGVSSERALSELIEKKRESGVFLSVLGFGNGNYKDNRMEALADKGNGNYAYIDSLLEAKKVLVTQMSGTLYTVAKDTKIQVEFNPARVHSYRLIGYENRLMANEDFNNDQKDAGDIGMGHRVTALYEIIPTDKDQSSWVDELRYQVMSETALDELATVKVRYKAPDAQSSHLIFKKITDESRDIRKEDFDFAQSVAGFGMLLRNSEHARALSYGGLIDMAKDAKGTDREGHRAEMIRMMEQAELLHRSAY